MEYIIDKYQRIPMFLSADDSVVDFYPKFGFSRAYDKLPSCECDFYIASTIENIKYLLIWASSF